MSNQTLCQSLAEYIVSLQPHVLPREVVEKAKAIVLHNLAISFGGVGTDQVNKALELVESRNGAATLVGQPFKASAAEAAFVNTVAMRALRMEDMVIPSMCHPGTCVVPAALALAEEEASSGVEMLAAIAIGYDIIGKVAGSLYTWDTSNRTPSHIYNALGVAATAARLMRLDAEQTTGALAHACNLGALITQGIEDFQYGVLTHNGMFAARLGEVRAPFPPDALEGPNGLYAVQLGGMRPTSEEILGSLGARFEILSAVLKPHPCTGSNLVPIEILRRAMREHSLTAEHIASVMVIRASNHERVISHHSYGPFEGYLGGMYEATSSLPFALAAVMVDGEITHAHFCNPNDPRIAAVIRRCGFEFTDELGLLDHKLIIKTRDGRTIEARGGREVLPKPNDAAILEKHAQPIVGAAKVHELQRRVAKLDDAPNVHALARCLA
jgi:2-methylcitrate dehydratase PrpD